MGRRRRNLFVLLFVVGLTAASALVIASKPTELGLDLRGGIELIYQGEPTARTPNIAPEDIDRSIEIIRERTDKLGVSEPEISRLGDDGIPVGLPDVQNAEQAIEQVGTTSQLYFYDWEPNVVPPPEQGVPKNPAQSPDPNPNIYSFPNLYDAVQFASKRKPECFQDAVHDRRAALLPVRRELPPAPGRPGGEATGPLPQSATRSSRPARRSSRCPRARSSSRRSREDPTLSQSPERGLGHPLQYVLKDRPALSGDDITNPEQNSTRPPTSPTSPSTSPTRGGRVPGRHPDDRPARRGDRPARRAPAAAADQYSQHFAVVLDNEVVTRPIINFVENPDGIDGRTGAQISGNFTISAAQDLAEFLRIGALPINLKLISQSTVSATLGQQALDQGLKAGIIGLILVVLFLIAYYRLLGVIAALGLVVYGVIFFALIKLIPITLTLPGIAGLVLTIGVAADANIVIFERIKEEARAGRSMLSAIAPGYRKGIATIIDANVITLLTAFILFVLATAGRQGVRVHPRRRHDRLAAHRGALHPGDPRLAGPVAAPALAAGARRRAAAGALALRLHRRQPLVLLDVGRDPGDRRDRRSPPSSSTSASTSSRGRGSTASLQQDGERRGRPHGADRRRRRPTRRAPRSRRSRTRSSART